ncbi:hypothetical protein KDK_38450 [Dictyobacter kobayashii]|uniref:Uncharacterized protein n=1 Tax=Dictyobacter kobayashii TaxID=2014872 RepID=A0A402ALX5_9CHLR|nr:hypothetical protein KDK_38450 [Dictyobacter kobayashii]
MIGAGEHLASMATLWDVNTAEEQASFNPILHYALPQDIYLFSEGFTSFNIASRFSTAARGEKGT